MYYEVYGEGAPLFFLHGFFLSSKHWKPFVEDFSDDFEVYLVDLTGHGRSSNFKDEISISEAAADLYNLISYLGSEIVKVIGFSYGGDVAFHLAANYPRTVESMVAIGGLGTWDVENYPDWIDYFSYDNIEQLASLRKHHPEEKRLKWLLDHFSEYSPSLSDQALEKVNARTMVVLGGNDESIPLCEVSRVRKLVPKFTLWIPPHTDHNVHEQEKKAFVKKVTAFLKKE